MLSPPTSNATDVLLWNSRGELIPNLPCSKCNVDDRHEVFLICARCNGGGHIDCFGLCQIPRGFWLCGMCTSPTAEAVIPSSPTSSYDVWADMAAAAMMWKEREIPHRLPRPMCSCVLRDCKACGKEWLIRK